MAARRASTLSTLAALVVGPVLGFVCAVALCAPVTAEAPAPHCGGPTEAPTPAGEGFDDGCCHDEALDEALGVLAKKDEAPVPTAAATTAAGLGRTPSPLAGGSRTAASSEHGARAAPDLVLRHAALLL